MTLESVLTIIAVAATITMALYAYVEFEKAELVRLRTYERLANVFFSKAKAALENDPEIAPSLITLIEEINDLINHKGIAFLIFWNRLRKLRGPDPCKTKSDDDQFPRDIEQYMTKRPDVVRDLYEGLIAGILAMTYTSAFWGTLARRAEAKLRQKQSKGCDTPEITVREIKEVYRKARDIHEDGFVRA